MGMGNSKPKKEAAQTNNVDFNDTSYQANIPFSWIDFPWGQIGTNDASNSHAAKFRTWFQDSDLNKGGQYWSQTHMSPEECWNSWDKAERFKSIKQFLISSLQEAASDDTNKPVQQSPRQRL